MENVFNKTGKVIHEVEEYEYQGVRFLYRDGENDLYCFFSSFSKKGVEQKYNYLKMKDHINGAILWFLDSNSPVADPRGTYFYGDKDCSYLSFILEIIHYIGALKSESLNYYYLGSSKGATGAILCALKMNKGTVIVNAPQIRFGSYMNKFCPDAVKHLGLDVSYLDNVIPSEIKTSARSKERIKFHICCGVLDKYHLEKHLLPFFSMLTNLEIDYRFKPIPGSHDGESLKWYQKFIYSIIGEEKDFIDEPLSSQLYFFDHFYEKIHFDIYKHMDFYDECHFSDYGSLKNYIVDKIKISMTDSIEWMIFDDDLLVKIPDAKYMDKCLYVKYQDTWMKAKKYQKSNCFKFSGLFYVYPESFKVFYKGNLCKYVV